MVQLQAKRIFDGLLMGRSREESVLAEIESQSLKQS